MISLKLLTVFFLCLIAMAISVPLPEPGWKKHEHYIIHVPYHVKHVHHHHVKKVPVYIKSHGWPSSGWSSSGWDWD